MIKPVVIQIINHSSLRYSLCMSGSQAGFFGKEEKRQVYFCTFQVIQAAKNSQGVSTGAVNRNSFR